MQNFKLSALLILPFLTALTQAWSINGHLFVANIAQDLLQENSQSSFSSALTMLSHLKAHDSNLTINERDHPFVESATFADDIKYHGGEWQSDFHFIDNPFIQQGTPQDYTILQAQHNLTTGIKNIIQWLSLRDDGTDYQQSYIYQYIFQTLYPSDESLAKSYALRLLIHYVGDVHQPFHTEALYSKMFPDGDKGGNLFTLPSHYSSSELHAVWDQQMYSESNHIARPFNQTAWDVFQPRVLNLMQGGQMSVLNSEDYQNTDISRWSQESYDIAITKYDGITKDVPLPQAYIDQNLIVCNERITLGGYRLAYLVQYIFGDPASEQFFLN